MVNLYLICLYTFTVYLLKLKVVIIEFILYEFTCMYLLIKIYNRITKCQSTNKHYCCIKTH